MRRHMLTLLLALLPVSALAQDPEFRFDRAVQDPDTGDPENMHMFGTVLIDGDAVFTWNQWIGQEATTALVDGTVTTEEFVDAWLGRLQERYESAQPPPASAARSDPVRQRTPAEIDTVLSDLDARIATLEAEGELTARQQLELSQLRALRP